MDCVTNKKVFSEHNKCIFCDKYCETVNKRYYHKKTCKMNQRIQRTPAAAKKIADTAFHRKVNNLEYKLREMCQTASACKVSNDVVVSNLMKVVSNDAFVRENVHALHERYKSI